MEHYTQTIRLSNNRLVEYDSDTGILCLKGDNGQITQWTTEDAHDFHDFLNAIFPPDRSYHRFVPMNEGDPHLAQVFRQIAQQAREAKRRICHENATHQTIALQRRLFEPLLHTLRYVVDLAEELATAFTPLVEISDTPEKIFSNNPEQLPG